MPWSMADCSVRRPVHASRSVRPWTCRNLLLQFDPHGCGECSCMPGAGTDRPTRMWEVSTGAWSASGPGIPSIHGHTGICSCNSGIPSIHGHQKAPACAGAGTCWAQCRPWLPSVAGSLALRPAGRCPGPDWKGPVRGAHARRFFFRAVVTHCAYIEQVMHMFTNNDSGFRATDYARRLDPCTRTV